MQLTIETFWNGSWLKCATVALKEPGKGFEGASTTEYELEYFARYAAVDSVSRRVIDARAVSADIPVTMEFTQRLAWPSFLLDLMPQGHARRKLAAHLKLNVDARDADLPLLMRSGANPIGNIRIAEAAAGEADRLKGVVRSGVTEDDIFGKSEHFLEVVDRFAMIASGSSGLQGEWPKVSLTLAQDGLYYPDTLVEDHEAVAHFIVKMVRSNERSDSQILEAEAGYSVVADNLGLNVHAPSRYSNGVLMIPRFDRTARGGVVLRHGQESLVSALGVAEFGYLGDHEYYTELLKEVSDDPVADIAEYVKRDILNRAMGNPDNHGRNTALTKKADGSVRLAPLFDFAPMKMSVDTPVKSTRWGAMRDTHRDHAPHWGEVCAAVFPESYNLAKSLAAEIEEFAQTLSGAKRVAEEAGITNEVITHAMSNLGAVVENVLDTASDIREVARKPGKGMRDG